MNNCGLNWEFDINFSNKGQNKKKFDLTIFINIILIIILTFMIAFLSLSLIFLKYEVIGVSMQPTYNIELEVGKDDEYYINSIYKDKVIINSLNKGTNSDIVVLNVDGEVVIKRIIATGGQTLTLKQEGNYYFFYVDGVKLEESYLGEKSLLMDNDYFDKFILLEHNKIIVEPTSLGKQATLVIPDGEIFVLGDNRTFSKDSHIYGSVKIENVLGKVVFSYKYNESFLSGLLNYLF